ncbi:MAG: hypothetical protein JF588_00080 [Caulobacterales bacterium]|nr:hypothetical protein [Caulobacterales bacterium]
MDGTDTVDGLAWWAGPGQDMGAAFARVHGHPSRTLAVRALATGMLDLFARDLQLAEVLKDAGRYVAAMLAFLLHETGELTLPRLKEACAKSGLLSPGRARAVLQFLEHVGYVQQLPRAGRRTAYALTPAFRTAWALQLRAALEAAAAVEPGVAALLARPGAVEAFGRVHAGVLLDATVGWGEPPPFLRVFQHPYAGTQILWTLIAAGDDPADFALARYGRISISALSKRFDVSRVHIKRIFQDAEQHGLGGLAPDGAIWFSDAGRDQMRMLFTAQLAHILAAAGQAALAAGGGPDDQICTVGLSGVAD